MEKINVSPRVFLNIYLTTIWLFLLFGIENFCKENCCNTVVFSTHFTHIPLKKLKITIDTKEKSIDDDFGVSTILMKLVDDIISLSLVTVMNGTNG